MEPRPPSPPPGTGLLLVAHGSRVEAHAEEVGGLARLVKDRVGGEVAAGFIELSTPPAAVAGEQLVVAGVRRLVVAPLLLFSAHHANEDVPTVAATLRERHPGLVVRVAEPLGPDPRLLSLCARRAGPPSGTSSGLLVVASGSSHELVRSEAMAVAEAVAAHTGHRFVTSSFATVSGSGLAGAVRRLVETGATDVTVVSWSLFDGRLVRAVEDEVDTVAADAPVPVRFAGRLGPDPVVAEVVADRHRQALAAVGVPPSSA